jgi:hypothetical protein
MTATTRTTSPAAQQQSSKKSIWNRLRWVGITGIIAAVAFSIAGVLLVMEDGNNGSIAAAIGILFMTAPVVLARRQPLLAVSIVTLAAIVNGLLWDDVIRCGAAIPALLYIVFAIGSRSRIGAHGEIRGWGYPILGLAIALLDVVAQRLWDPVLDNGSLLFAGGLVLVVWAAGLGWAAIEPRLGRHHGSTTPADVPA